MGKQLASQVVTSTYDISFHFYINEIYLYNLGKLLEAEQS